MREDGYAQVGEENVVLTSDAAGWSASDDDSRAWWAEASAGSMIAIELAEDGLRRVAIEASEALVQIARYVGGPLPAGIGYVRQVQFWTGHNSESGSLYNSVASWCLIRMLEDVRDGAYIASDAERDRVAALQALSGMVPEIYGRCLITGVGEDGAPAPLDANFESWFNGLLAQWDPACGQLFWKVG